MQSDLVPFPYLFQSWLSLLSVKKHCLLYYFYRQQPPMLVWPLWRSIPTKPNQLWQLTKCTLKIHCQMQLCWDQTERSSTLHDSFNIDKCCLEELLVFENRGANNLALNLTNILSVSNVQCIFNIKKGFGNHFAIKKCNFSPMICYLLVFSKRVSTFIHCISAQVNY